MKIDEAIGALKKKFGDGILKIEKKSTRRLYVDLESKHIIPLATFVFRDLDARFMIATGVDTPRGVLEILYHFAFDQDDFVITLRALVDKKQPEIDSLTGVIPGAEWIEREMWELLGINFRNHPGLKRFLLPEDWPAGKYPLRRDDSGMPK